MKMKSGLALALGGVIALVGSSRPAAAADLNWGADGNGGSGTWDNGTTADWFNGTNAVPWSAGNTAVFGGTAGAVSVADTIPGVSGLTFNADGYSLSGGALTLTANGVNVASGDSATIGSVLGGTAGVTLSGGGTLVYTTNNTYFGGDAHTYIANGTLVIASGGSYSNNTWNSIGVGAGDNGTMVIKGTGWVYINGDLNAGDNGASNNPAVGVLDMSDSAKLIVNHMFLGSAFSGATAGAVGTMNQTNGTVLTFGGGDGNLLIGGRNSGSTAGIGTYNLMGGSVTVSNAGNVWVGGYGTGTLNQSGGDFNTFSWTSIGRQNGSTGVVNITAGTLTHTSTGTRIIVGEDGTGTLNVSGTGHVVTTGGLRIGNTSSGNGTVNLNGGTITAPFVENAGGSSTFNFNGGVLQAGGSSTNFMNGLGTADILAGGAIIDSQDNDITIPQSLTDFTASGGSLTKKGTGSLTLAGNNTYTGPTLVNAGTLNLLANGSFLTGDVTVSPGASFGLVYPFLYGQLYIPNLTLGGTGGASLNFDLGSYGNPPSAVASVTGTLKVNGPVTVNIADDVPSIGTIPLIQYATLSGSGSFTLGNIPVGIEAHLETNSSTINLVITSSSGTRWDGQVNGDWDIGNTTNWVKLGETTPTVFEEGNPVVFDDQALGTTDISIVDNVHPGTITFANTNLSYTLEGPNKISGSTGLTKNGTNSLTIQNAALNDYTGPTIITGGALNVTNLANGGSPSAIGASSASPGNLVLGNATLHYSGPSTSINRGFTAQGTATIETENNLALSGNVVASGGGRTAKTGPGNLIITTVGTNQFSKASANPGFSVANGTLVFDGTAGPQVNNVDGEMWVADSFDTSASLVLTNTTVNLTSWLAIGRGNGNSGFTSTVTLYNSTLTCGNMSLGYDNGLPNLANQVLTLNDSKIIDGGNFYVAERPGSSATIYLNGNSVLSANGPFLPGMQSGATGMVVVADSSILTNNQWASIGANGVGSLVMKDNATMVEGADFNLGDYGAADTVGTLTLQDNAQIKLTGGGVFVGKTASAIGHVTQTGGVFDGRVAGVFQLAQQTNSVGTWTQSGGTTYGGGWVSIGRGNDSSGLSAVGTMVISGGTFDQTGTGNGLIVGEQGTGTLTITNTGTVISEANNIGVAIGWNNGAGTVNLAGGELDANFIQGGSGTSTFNFLGGLLKARPGARSNFMTNITSVMVISNVVIDTDTNTIAINQPLLAGGAGGGIVKSGSGTLQLNGANTYTGATVINDGGIGGNGTIQGPVTVSASGTLSPGAGIGTLTINNNLNLSGNTLIEVSKDGAGSNDVVNVTGALTYGGTLTVANVGTNALAAGDTFHVFTGFSSETGSVSVQGSAGPGLKYEFDPATGIVSVVSTGPILNASVGSSGITFSWTGNYELIAQTNSLNVGISTNWYPVPNGTNGVTVPIGKDNPTVFFGLKPTP